MGGFVLFLGAGVSRRKHTLAGLGSSGDASRRSLLLCYFGLIYSLVGSWLLVSGFLFLFCFGFGFMAMVVLMYVTYYERMDGGGTGALLVVFVPPKRSC